MRLTCISTAYAASWEANSSRTCAASATSCPSRLLHDEVTARSTIGIPAGLRAGGGGIDRILHLPAAAGAKRRAVRLSVAADRIVLARPGSGRAPAPRSFPRKSTKKQRTKQDHERYGSLFFASGHAAAGSRHAR